MTVRKAALFMLVTALLFSGAARASEKWPALAAKLGENDAVRVADPQGAVLFAHNRDQKLIPASALKVLTALFAIDQLGPDYRFPTEFYVNEDNDLLIKGYGDPLLVSESVRAIAGRLAVKLDQVRDIVLDDTFFDRPVRIPGRANATLQPYNAPNGALCVNFNTVFFKIKNGSIQSAEPQTPMLPIARARIREQKNTAKGRILLSDHADDSLIYAGQLFSYFLRQAGLQTRGKIRKGRVDEDPTARLVYRHAAQHDLTAVIESLLEYSNNYMANQLLLASGAAAYGPPATLDKGLNALKRYCRKELGLTGFTIVEGSGLSRKNRLSARMFAAILSAFKPYYHLMPQNGRVHAKTGTLDGIQTRAGYIESEGKGLFSFVVLLNSPGKRADPLVRQIEELIAR